MTLSSRKVHGVREAALLLALLALPAGARTPPPMPELVAAQAELAAAEALHPRGHAAEALDEARRRYEAAQRLMAERRYKQVPAVAEQAQAAAELARARALLAAAQEDVDSKAARNAELRRAQLNRGGE